MLLNQLCNSSLGYACYRLLTNDSMMLEHGFLFLLIESHDLRNLPPSPLLFSIPSDSFVFQALSTWLACDKERLYHHPVEINSDEFGSDATAGEACEGPDPTAVIVVAVVPVTFFT